MLRFYSPGGKLAMLNENRLFYLTCRANGEFSTPVFTIPGSGLFLDANILYQPDEGESGRAYVMAELHEENGSVIPGFARAKCLLANKNSSAIPLVWEGSDLSALVGRKVRLRFFLRDAKLYRVFTNSQ